MAERFRFRYPCLINKPQPPRESQLRLELPVASNRNRDKLPKVPPAGTGFTFGYIAGNRNGARRIWELNPYVSCFGKSAVSA